MAYSLQPALAPAQLRLLRVDSGQGKGNGESLTHFPVQGGEHLLADRGYSNYASVQHWRPMGPWYRPPQSPGRSFSRCGAKALRLAAKAAQSQKNQPSGLLAVALTGAAGQTPGGGRLCVLRKKPGRDRQGAAHGPSAAPTAMGMRCNRPRCSMPST